MQATFSGVEFLGILFKIKKQKESCRRRSCLIKLPSVCHRLRAVNKIETARTRYVCHVCFGSKNSENVLFRSIIISLENSVST